jgi:hypothetical protein
MARHGNDQGLSPPKALGRREAGRHDGGHQPCLTFLAEHRLYLGRKGLALG